MNTELKFYSMSSILSTLAAVYFSTYNINWTLSWLFMMLGVGLIGKTCLTVIKDVGEINAKETSDKI